MGTPRRRGSRTWHQQTEGVGRPKSKAARPDFSKNANDLEFFLTQNQPYRLKNNLRQRRKNSIVFSKGLETTIWHVGPWHRLGLESRKKSEAAWLVSSRGATSECSSRHPLPPTAGSPTSWAMLLLPHWAPLSRKEMEEARDRRMKEPRGEGAREERKEREEDPRLAPPRVCPASL